MAEVSLALSLSGNSFKLPLCTGRLESNGSPSSAALCALEDARTAASAHAATTASATDATAVAGRGEPCFCASRKFVGEFRTHTVEGKAAGGEARPRSTGQQEAHLAKAGFRVQLVDMQLEATGRAASPRSQGGEVKSSAVLLRTLASASAFAPSKLCDPAEHI